MHRQKGGSMKQTDIWRCRFHLTPPIGWMNDPNGLCQYQGIYHVFFQYAPEYPVEDTKEWGHYTSPDLIHWNFAGTALYPDTAYDRNGAYSGSACIDQDTMVIYYTGNVKQEGPHDYTHSGRESNTLRVTSRDGRHFTEKQCVLRNQDYPEGYTCHIRDPKVWKDGDRYKMVLGGRRNDDSGAVLLYESIDGIGWNYVCDITSGQPFGFMWECPDLFELDGQHFLACCPQGIPAGRCRFQNYHLAGYFPLDVSSNTESGTELQNHGADIVRIDGTLFREWDYGFDFYAPQTFVDEARRRILFGWAGLPDMPYQEPGLEEQNWIYNLTVPRVVTCRNGILFQYPVPELDQLHGREQQPDSQEWFSVEVNCFDWQLIPKDPSAGFSIHITKNILFSYNGAVLSLSFCGKIGAGRTRRTVLCSRVEHIRILADCSILEFYVNYGEIVMTTRFFPEYEESGLCAGGIFIKNQLWDMERSVVQIHTAYND